jgi:hypothetical protein
VVQVSLWLIHGLWEHDPSSWIFSPSILLMVMLSVVFCWWQWQGHLVYSSFCSLGTWMVPCSEDSFCRVVFTIIPRSSFESISLICF